MTTPTEPTPDATLARLADALVDRIMLQTKAADSRKMAGSHLAHLRAEHREEARECQRLRIAVLNADPAALAQVLSP